VAYSVKLYNNNGKHWTTEDLTFEKNNRTDSFLFMFLEQPPKIVFYDAIIHILKFNLNSYSAKENKEVCFKEISNDPTRIDFTISEHQLHHYLSSMFSYLDRHSVKSVLFE